MSQSSSTEALLPPVIRRAKFDTLTIYEISEEELLIIERGSPDSIYLTISIALISFAMAIFCSLLVTDIKSNIVMTVYIVFVVVGAVVGGIMLLLWKRSKNSVSVCIANIRKRLPPPDGELVE
ncbi:hypothetical protein [Providencia stuartii]|uniref:hypothetical protein n=1 Tax=Providencia stuartii TaxID=588 RepID=UPI00300C48ED